jgi:hypothetical protein
VLAALLAPASLPVVLADARAAALLAPTLPLLLMLLCRLAPPSIARLAIP